MTTNISNNEEYNTEEAAKEQDQLVPRTNRRAFVVVIAVVLGIPGHAQGGKFKDRREGGSICRVIS